MKPFSKLEEGDRVQARIRVYDLPGENFGPPHPRTLKKYGQFAAHIHAEPGELGTVAMTSDGVTTVTFDRTGTSTDVVAEEVEHVPAERCMHHWGNVLHQEMRSYAYAELAVIAKRLGYFYFVWNGRVIITNAYEMASPVHPESHWPTIEEFFGKD